MDEEANLVVAAAITQRLVWDQMVVVNPDNVVGCSGDSSAWRNVLTEIPRDRAE
jgi:hypothetical protein